MPHQIVNDVAQKQIWGGNPWKTCEKKYLEAFWVQDIKEMNVQSNKIVLTSTFSWDIYMKYEQLIKMLVFKHVFCQFSLTVFIIQTN